MNSWIHPGAILILGALLLPLFKGRARQGYLLLLPALAFMAVLGSAEGQHGIFNFLGQKIVFGRVDKLSIIFGYIFSIAAFAGMLFGINVKEDGHQIAALVYAGSAMGAVFAGDYLSLFIFWEFMAFASMFLILYRGTKKAYDAATRYILIHIFGGVCLMAGIFLQYSTTHSFAFNHVEVGGAAAVLILIGFILNAAVPPLGAWLADAYPEATVSGAVFMSAFTTKSAVYALIRGFAGADVLVWLGVIMAVYGVVYAVLENDIRRLLAYHIISQVGYMVAAVGIGTEMAINGATAHAFAHIIYKGLLFMGAGSVLYVTGKSKLTELGGLYRTMPLTFVLYMVGGFAISSVPLFSGFVSKSIVVSAAAESHLSYAWLFLTLASAGTFLHTGLKLPYFTFMGENKGIAAKEPPLNMLLGMAFAAFLCIFIGIYPDFLYRMLPYAIDYRPYSAEHIVWTSQILFFTGLAFYIYIKKLGGEETISIDTDWFYRKGSLLFMDFARKVVLKVDERISNAYKGEILEPSKRVAANCWRFDISFIDGIVNGTANLFAELSTVFRRLQTGQVQHYAIIIVTGVIVLINLLLFFR
ncbi:MAG: Na(+)/H(+) antiporter subunit D [Deltaproteobacteria bacterium]|nr:Na(+)/H(+) antiporter subunit D [Deltaproteobacteria bacterium]